MRTGVAIAAIAIIALCAGAGGCGRIGFDDHTGVPGGDDGPTLGGDGPLPVVCTATPPEVCNGIDDDCNQLVDEGCPCAPVDTSVTESPSSYTHALLWTGATGLVQVEGDAATIEVWMIDSTGALGPHVPVYSGTVGTVGAADAAWSGRTVLIGYDHDQTFAVVTYDPQTGLLGTPATIDATYPGAGVRITWAGDRFVVAWITAGYDVIARDLSEDGAPLGAETVLAPATNGVLGAIAVGRDGTLACVRDAADGHARVIAVAADGVVTTHDAAIGTGMGCELLAVPNGYVMFYRQPSSTPATLAFLDGAGTVLGTEPIAADPGYVDLAVARVPTGLWVLATAAGPSLYSYVVDALELDAGGHVTAGPTQQASLSAYLFSPPRVVVSAGRRISSWSTNPGAAPSDYKIVQTCN